MRAVCCIMKKMCLTIAYELKRQRAKTRVCRVVEVERASVGEGIN